MCFDILHDGPKTLYVVTFAAITQIAVIWAGNLPFYMLTVLWKNKVIVSSDFYLQGWFRDLLCFHIIQFSVTDLKPMEVSCFIFMIRFHFSQHCIFFATLQQTWKHASGWRRH